MYRGKEACQGCSKTGEECPRAQKTNLCRSCKEFLRAGNHKEKEAKFKYVGISQHYHAYSGMTFNDNTLNVSVHALLAALHFPDAVLVDSLIPLKHSSGDNCGQYNIPETFVGPLTKFMQDMDEFARNIKKQIDELPSMARRSVADEESRIYNEGVKKGRDLLFALNSGSITMEQFGEKLNYNLNK